MKNLFPLFIVLIIVSSCSKEHKTTPSVNSNIIGKWYFTADTLTQYVNGNFDFQYTNFAQSDYKQFNSDGTGLEVSDTGRFVTKFNYIISGNILTLNTPAQTINDPIYGPEQIPASIEKAVIKTLTNTSLELYFDDKNSDGSEDIESEYFTNK